MAIILVPNSGEANLANDPANNRWKYGLGMDLVLYCFHRWAATSKGWCPCPILCWCWNSIIGTIPDTSETMMVHNGHIRHIAADMVRVCKIMITGTNAGGTVWLICIYSGHLYIGFLKISLTLHHHTCSIHENSFNHQKQQEFLQT